MVGKYDPDAEEPLAINAATAIAILDRDNTDASEGTVLSLEFDEAAGTITVTVTHTQTEDDGSANCAVQDFRASRRCDGGGVPPSFQTATSGGMKPLT